MSGKQKFIFTSIILLLAFGVLAVKYWSYITNPWTRDGQVRAQVIQITPRVSGPIVKLPVQDNQLVKTGDLLFKIDPRTFEADLAKAKADLDQAKSQHADAKSKADRARRIRIRNPGAMSVERVNSRIAEEQEALANVEEYRAELDSAKLNLEFTQVKSPVDGYVTNLNLRMGSQAVTNQAALALVDINSFWIDGFFKENIIQGIRQGDRAIVTLMSYPDQALEGRVNSIGWGIAQDDGSTGEDLLPSISPTFEWIRLAQRVPVRIHIDELPEGVKLRVGTTASVLVMTGTQGRQTKTPTAPLPRTLQ